MIEITSSYAYVCKRGRGLSNFVGVKIVVGHMRFIPDGLLMEQGLHNIIGRGQVGALRDIFGMDLKLVV
jgi:hypothetical protein